MSSLRLGVLAALLSLGMLITELVWKPVFTVRLTEDFALPVWIPFGIYALLQFLAAWMTHRSLELSDEDLARWGEKLTEVTPEILGRLEAREKVEAIAGGIEERKGIPSDVTLRYIFALGQHARQLAGQADSESGSGSSS